MKLNSITIKNMHNINGIKKFMLDDVLYFYGKNGAGKSTILQAIQLALLGYIPGTNKKPADIFKHSNSTSMEVSLELIEEDRIYTISRSYEINSRGTVSSNVSVYPAEFDIDSLMGDASLPIYNFSEFMDMSPNNMKDWFIKFLPEPKINIIWTDWFNTLNADLKYDYSKFIFELIDKCASNKATTLSDISNMYSIVKEFISSHNTELKLIDSTLKSMVYYSDYENMSENISELTLKRATFQQLLSDLKAYNEAVEHNKYIYTKLDALKVDCKNINEDPEYIELSKQLNDISTELKSKNEHMANIKARLYSLNDSKISRAMHDSVCCPIINEECERLSEFNRTIELKNAEIDTQIHKIEKDIDEINAAMNTLLDKRRNISNKLQEIEQKYDMADKLSGMIKQVKEVDTSYTVDEIEAEINIINDKLIKLEANEKFMKLNDNLTNRQYELEHELAFLKICEKRLGVNGLQSEIMNTPIEGFAIELNGFLSKIYSNRNISASFNLNNKSNSFSFGIIDDTTQNYTPYNLLSSGEKAIYTFAIILAIVNLNNSKLKLLLIDDLIDHLDDNASIKLFEYISTVSGVQIISAGVKPCDFKFKYEI